MPYWQCWNIFLTTSRYYELGSVTGCWYDILTCLWMFGTRGLQSRRGEKKTNRIIRIGSWVLADPHHRWRFPIFLSGSKPRCRKPVKSRLSFTSQVDILIHHSSLHSHPASSRPPFLRWWRLHRGVTAQRRSCTRNSPVSVASWWNSWTERTGSR